MITFIYFKKIRATSMENTNQTPGIRVIVVRHLTELISEVTGKSVEVQNLIYDRKKKCLEGYVPDEHDHFVRVFCEPINDGGFILTGEPVDPICELQAYKDAKVAINGEAYMLKGLKVQWMETSFDTLTGLWGFMESYLTGIARWGYNDDFSDIRVLGKSRRLSDVLSMK